MALFLYLFAALLQPSPARADILLIAMNTNPGEFAAARKAAELTKQNLFVVGLPDPKLLKKKADLEKELRALEKQSAKAPEDTALFKTLQDKYTEMRSLMMDLSYSGDHLAADLDQLAKKKVQISYTVITGHDGNSHFFGTNGDLDATELREAFTAYPSVMGNSYLLVMQACYTSTPGALELDWRSLLPRVMLISGFDGSAPLGQVKAGQAYLGDILVRAKDVIAAGDNAKALRKVVDGLAGVQSLYAMNQSPALLLTCGDDLYINRKEVIPLAETHAQCGGLLTDANVKGWNEKFACYYSGMKGCENPPADTANGELRALYNNVQRARHCIDALSLEEGPLLSVDPVVLIRLLFFRDVLKNTAAHAAEEIRSIDSMLPEVSKLGDIANFSRKEELDRLTKARQIFTSLLADPKNIASERGAKLLAAESNLSQLERIMSLEESCVPFPWVEPHATAESPCERAARAENITEAQLLRAYHDALSAQADAQPEVAAALNQVNTLFQAYVNGDRQEEYREPYLAAENEVNRLEQIAKQGIAQQEEARLKSLGSGFPAASYLAKLEEFRKEAPSPVSEPPVIDDNIPPASDGDVEGGV